MPETRFHSLLCHASGTPPTGLGITAAASRNASGELVLDYRLCAIGSLELPPPAAPGPTDGLWQQTCCEAFIGGANAPAYREFNLSPSGQWAVYDFVSYRQRNECWQAPAAPSIACRNDGQVLHLTARIPLVLLPAGASHLGLTVVAATPAGEKSYWALAHAAAQPDFHLAASFTLPLP